MTQGGPSDEWVVVAIFQRPHGLKGECRLRPLTRDPGDLADPPVRVFRTRRNGRLGGPLTLGDTRLHEGLVYASFDEIPDRTAAEQLTNAELVLPESQLWPATGGGYYVFQLENLEVRNAETGEVMGAVRTARQGAAQDLLVLRLDEAPGRDVLLPIVPNFVPEIDIAGGFVRVSLPEGLLDA